MKAESTSRDPDVRRRPSCSPSPAPQGDRFANLDGIRGVAAILVCLAHVNGVLPILHPGMAGLAVDLFFIMSGYVISRSYGERLRSGMTFRQFAAARFARLFPMYAVGVAISLGLIMSFDLGRNNKSLAFNAFMLPSLFSSQLYPLNGPGWSLFYEFIANFAFAALIGVLSRGVLLAVVGAAGAFLVAAGLLGLNLDGGWDWSGAPVGLARVMFGFFAGVVIQRLVTLRRSVPGIVGGLVIALSIAPLIGSPAAVAGLWHALVLIAVLPAVVMLAVSLEPRGVFRPFSEALGRLSYPLYTIHYPALFGAQLALDRIDPALWTRHPHAIAWTFVVSIIAVSLLLDRIVDEPARRRLGRALVALVSRGTMATLPSPSHRGPG